MKLRQMMAVGAASALLTPALGVLAATPANAARGDLATLEIDPPKAVGVNAEPVEFDAEITNAGGLEHENARLLLRLKLSDFFTDENGDLDPSMLRLEFRNEAGAWTRIALTADGDEVVGSPDRRFLTEAADETLPMRVSVAFAAAANRRAKGSELAGERDPLARARTLREQAVRASEPAACGLTDPGFTLAAALRDLDQAGTPVGDPIATDTDKVQVGGAMVAFDGLAAAEIVAGDTPRAFTLHLCNSSDSAYPKARPTLFLLRGGLTEPGGRLDLEEVVLEQRQGNGWAPVPVTQEQGSDAVVAELGEGAPLAARQRVARQLRLGFVKAAKPGKASAVAVAELPDSGQQVGIDFADYSIVAAPTQPVGGQPRPATPELPDTGTDPRIALLGAGLVVAGVGAVTGSRRRREVAG